eukprot:1730966-Pleurochrysis_carterae.AAC.1
MLERSDDEILELDNKSVKHIKYDLIFLGGSSYPSKSVVEETEFQPEKEADGNETGHFTERQSVSKRMAGHGAQFATVRSPYAWAQGTPGDAQGASR